MNPTATQPPATQARVKYRATANSEYHVHDTTGTHLGTVRKRTQRYNLRRVILDTWWQIDDVPGFNNGANGTRTGKHRYDTRTEAVDALLRYLNRTDLPG